MKSQLFGWISLSVIAVIAAPSPAAMVNWGDLEGDTVVFEDVTEDNMLPTTVYVPDGDSPVAMGDNLLLDPSQFIAQASGNESEIIDSELAFTIAAKDGYSIDSFSFGEAGSVTLAGGLIGGMAGATVEATVLVTGAIVDGQFVDLNGQFVPFNATNGGEFLLPDYQGTNQWSGTSAFDVSSVFSGEVTSLSIVIDNTLSAEADEVSSAFIDKKEISITVTTTPEIPEPAAAAIAALGAIAGVMRRR